MIHIDFRPVTPRVNSLINARQIIGEESYKQWMDLDHILVQLCKLTAVWVRVSYHSAWWRRKEMCEYVEGLLPEMSKGESTRLVDYDDFYLY